MASAFSRTVDVDGPGLHMVAVYDYDYNGDGYYGGDYDDGDYDDDECYGCVGGDCANGP